MQRHLVRWLAIAAVTLGACGTTSTAPPNQADQFPVTVTMANGATVTISKQPHRIISLSPSATEMLFAIDAGAQVVAVDEQSNYPSSAPTTKLSGFQPNAANCAGEPPSNAQVAGLPFASVISI